MPSIGYEPGASAAAYGQINTADSINQRAYVSAKMVEDGWLYQINVRGGRRESTIPNVTLAAWAVGAGTAPAALVARSAAFTTGTYMLDEDDGTTYTRAVQTAAKFQSGKRYALGFVASGATFGYGRIPMASIASGEVYDEFRKTVASGPTPQDPFNASSSADDQGWMAVWADYEVNVAPNVPTSTIPSDGSSVSSLTPTFSGNFRDDNEILPNDLAGDQLGQVQIMVLRQVGDVVTIMWNHTYTSSAEERTNRRFSIPYAGATLTEDVEYSWNCRVSDQFGAWSPWTNSANPGGALDTFTPGSGYITVSSGTPTGKQESTSPGPFTGVWSHTGGSNATEVKVRIIDTDTDVVVRESGYTSIGGSGTAPGGTLSKTFGSFTPLDLGGHYAYQLRAMAGVAESNWSDERAFHINAAPTIPVVLAPINGSVSSSRPELVVQSTDADSDDLPGAGHVVSARIKNSGGTVLFTRTMTYDAPTASFRYQTTSTDLASTGNYKFDFYAYDGSVYSSGSASLGAGSLSTEIAFEYSTGPVITHTSPALDAEVNTDTPWYNWTVTGQVRKRIRVFDATSTDSMVYDSGEITNTDTSFRQPAGYLEDGAEYYRIIDVWNVSNQQGTSIPAYFTVSYDAATALNNFTASAHRARHDVTATAVLLSWDQTEYTAGQFDRYVIARRAVEGTDFAVDDDVQGENQRIGEITSPSQTTFVDYLPASGVSYVYGVKQIVEVDEVVIASPYVHAEIAVTFQDTVICDANAGGARRFILQARQDRSTNYEIEQVFKQPWGGATPAEFRTSKFGRVVEGTFQIVADSASDAEVMIREIEKVYFYGGPLCYRDGRGTRFFGAMFQFRRVDPPGGRVQRVELGIRQTNAHEVIAT
jgi:hypothetical protein